MRKLYCLILLVFCLFFGVSAQSQVQQDTLRLSLNEAETLFLKENLLLLAQRYNIDQAKAGIITAKLWDNPDLNFNYVFYNFSTKRFFQLDDENSQVSAQLTQIIRTAGKRNKNIRIAKTTADIAEYQYYDLLRTLRYTLRNDFYNNYYLQQTQKVYFTEINALRHIVDGYKIEVGKGNIARKDLLRIQSQLYSLEAELAGIQNQIDDIQSELKLLISAGAKDYVVSKNDYGSSLDHKEIVQNVAYQTLVDSASKNRFDLRMAQSGKVMSEQNLSLQKAMAVPDVSFIVGYDRLGSFVKDYNYLGLDFNLPTFNRNQGNIKAAKAQLKASEAALQLTANTVESQVANAYIGALRAETLLNSFDVTFESDQKNIIEEVTKNFEKRNISLLDFTDFYDAYKQNVVQVNNLRYQRLAQLEQLNFTTGTLIFNR
ncbi:MAG: TolC family protein [Bacteroidetes bacterium]|nr:TolC family protein [Bacteroidota bacterium]MBS1741117.1 TolC family protein [Bacteroidota bacterium]